MRIEVVNAKGHKMSIDDSRLSFYEGIGFQPVPSVVESVANEQKEDAPKRKTTTKKVATKRK